MNKRRQIIKTDEDGITVIEEHEPPRTFLRQILHWFGETLLWLLALTPGVLIIAYGVRGVQSKHLRAWRAGTDSFGDDAVGFSWISIAIGIWALGHACQLKTGRLVLNLIGWILAVAAFGVGLWILIRRFLNHPA